MKSDPWVDVSKRLHWSHLISDTFSVPPKVASKGQWPAEMEPIARQNDHGNHTRVWVTQGWGSEGDGAGGSKLNALMRTTKRQLKNVDKWGRETNSLLIHGDVLSAPDSLALRNVGYWRASQGNVVFIAILQDINERHIWGIYQNDWKCFKFQWNR